MPDRTTRLPLWGRVLAPLVVVSVALLIGSGVLHGTAQSASERAASIESVVRCPSCTDVSVAQSEETTALAVRHEIVRAVDKGQSTEQIEHTLVEQYGPTILLVPPDTGGISFIWVAPIALAVSALAVVGTLFWRRSRQFGSLREQQAAS